MPASPRAAAVGIGAAVAIALGIPLILGLVATHAMSLRNARETTIVELEALYADIRQHGLQFDVLPTPATQPDVFSQLQPPVIGVLGEYAVFEDDFPLHRLPRNVIALLQYHNDDHPIALPASQFEGPGELGDVVGRSGGIGTGIVFADGLVIVLRDTTPLEVIRPFVTRNTAVRRDRIKELSTYALQ